MVQGLLQQDSSHTSTTMQFSDGFSLPLKLTLTVHISVFQGVAFKRDIVLTIKLSVGCRRLLNIGAAVNLVSLEMCELF